MGTWEIFKMLASLVLVLAVMGALLWTLRRLQNKLQASSNTTRQMQLLETLSLGPRQKVLLMQVDGQRMLIGVTAQQMQALGQWPVAPVAPTASRPSPARTENQPHA